MWRIERYEQWAELRDAEVISSVLSPSLSLSLLSLSLFRHHQKTRTTTSAEYIIVCDCVRKDRARVAEDR